MSYYAQAILLHVAKIKEMYPWMDQVRVQGMSHMFAFPFVEYDEAVIMATLFETSCFAFEHWAG